MVVFFATLKSIFLLNFSKVANVLIKNIINKNTGIYLQPYDFVIHAHRIPTYKYENLLWLYSTSKFFRSIAPFSLSYFLKNLDSQLISYEKCNQYSCTLKVITRHFVTKVPSISRKIDHLSVDIPLSKYEQKIILVF